MKLRLTDQNGHEWTSQTKLERTRPFDKRIYHHVVASQYLREVPVTSHCPDCGQQWYHKEDIGGVV